MGGFFDAEGYVNLSRKVLRIGQKHSEILDIIKSHYNCGKVYNDKKSNTFVLDFGNRNAVLKITESIVNRTLIKRPKLISVHKALKAKAEG